MAGEDNVVRGARLLHASGSIIDRPIQKLYPLKIQSEQIMQIQKLLQKNQEIKRRGNKTKA